MRILVLGKYPPIQGGVAARTFWMVEALAAEGHDVTVVTNARDELQEPVCVARKPTDTTLNSRIHIINTRETDYPVRPYYRPYANPFVSKLAALAISASDPDPFDVIFSNYLEPYGVAAMLASQTTGAPHMATHAGSDVARLATLPDRSPIYQQVVETCAYFMTHERAELDLMRAGYQLRQAVPKPIYSPGKDFSPDSEPMTTDRMEELRVESSPSSDPKAITIGVYGKPGRFKGSSELVSAVRILTDEGFAVRLRAVWGDSGPHVEQLLPELRKLPDWELLSFFHPAEAPAFIRSCSIVAFLENNFPVKAHRPRVPSEVLRTGTCLLVTREICELQASGDLLTDLKNCLVLDGPLTPQSVAEKVRPNLRASTLRRVGAAGALALGDQGTGPGVKDFLLLAEESMTEAIDPNTLIHLASAPLADGEAAIEAVRSLRDSSCRKAFRSYMGRMRCLDANVSSDERSHLRDSFFETWQFHHERPFDSIQSFSSLASQCFSNSRLLLDSVRFDEACWRAALYDGRPEHSEAFSLDRFSAESVAPLMARRGDVGTDLLILISPQLNYPGFRLFHISHDLEAQLRETLNTLDETCVGSDPNTELRSFLTSRSAS